MGKKDNEARLNWRKLSTKEGRRYGRLGAELAAAEEALDYDRADDILEEIRRLVGRIVEYLPQDWLVEDAPDTDGLDWTDPESWDWISLEGDMNLGQQMRAHFDNLKN